MAKRLATLLCYVERLDRGFWKKHTKSSLNLLESKAGWNLCLFINDLSGVRYRIKLSKAKLQMLLIESTKRKPIDIGNNIYSGVEMRNLLQYPITERGKKSFLSWNKKVESEKYKHKDRWAAMAGITLEEYEKRYND